MKYQIQSTTLLQCPSRSTLIQSKPKLTEPPQPWRHSHVARCVRVLAVGRARGQHPLDGVDHLQMVRPQLTQQGITLRGAQPRVQCCQTPHGHCKREGEDAGGSRVGILQPKKFQLKIHMRLEFPPSGNFYDSKRLTRRWTTLPSNRIFFCFLCMYVRARRRQCYIYRTG